MLRLRMWGQTLGRGRHLADDSFVHVGADTTCSLGRGGHLADAPLVHVMPDASCVRIGGFTRVCWQVRGHGWGDCAHCTPSVLKGLP